jgi:hypothetical protein
MRASNAIVTDTALSCIGCGALFDQRHAHRWLLTR